MGFDLFSFVKDTVSADTSKVAGAIRGLPHDADGLAKFAWPWNIAKKGAQYLSDHTSAVEGLVSGGHAVVSSPGGSSIVAGVAASPTSPDATGQVVNNGLFTNALNSVQADQLLRTVFVGWAGGGQIGVFGGGGGEGVGYDIVSRGTYSGVSYGLFKIGIGFQIDSGLLVGAMTRPPDQLSDKTAVFEFGATLVGLGVLVQVVMAESDLSLIGFVFNLGVGAGYSATTGYGSIKTL